jgi:hypothetical protein
MMSFLKTATLAAALFIAANACAQQSGATTDTQPTADMQAMHARVMAADEHLKTLLTKLSLNAEQQSTVIRILFELQDETMRVVQNENLSHEEQVAQIKTLRSMAHTHVYATLNDEQKKTLDEFMRAPHE